MGSELRGVFAATYRQNTNGVDAKIVKLAVSHCEKRPVDLKKSWVSQSVFQNGSAEVEGQTNQ